MHLISGIADEWQGREPPPPAKLNVKTRPLPSLHFGISNSFGFSRLLFFAFWECFLVISGFCIAVQELCLGLAAVFYNKSIVVA